VKQLSLDGRYIVSLDIFEGPLDLLLHLIRKHELEISDIPISFITKKYLEYLDLMKQLNLDLASEYLEMAATLALIKSRILVPSDDTDEDDLLDEGPDPREELVRRLLDYQKYKTAAMELTEMPRLGRDSFPRGATESVQSERELASPGLFALMEAFHKILTKSDKESVHEISISRITVSSRIDQLVDIFRGKSLVAFNDLFEGQLSRADLVVTFLSILEMVKHHLILIHQAGMNTEIHITATDSIKDSDKILRDEIMEEQ
jgi:segregation and condensation protein A